MGKPVVATKTEFMHYFADYCYLATTKKEYISTIQKAIEEDTASLHEQRIAFARTHSWEHNVQKIYDLVAASPSR